MRDASPSLAGSNLTGGLLRFPLPASRFPRFFTRYGNATSRSAKSGASALARVTSSRFTSAVTIASSNSGPRTRISPCGLKTSEPPGNPLPPSNPTRLAYATYTPCSSANPRTVRSQRTTLAGRRLPSGSPPVPRAGDALGRMISCAPSNAARVPVSECQASSQIRIAARPQRVSNARTSWPRSTKRSSSNTPYVGRNTLRWTCVMPDEAGPDEALPKEALPREA